MPAFICVTCGTQFVESATPPAACSICLDDRQYVGWNGQCWTTHEALHERHCLRLGMDDGLFAIGIDGAFAIPQRALLLPTDGGNLLWECLSLVTDQAVAALNARGGVDRIIISHPHFYASMVQWSDALGGVPILLHEADRHWVQRPAAQIRFWRGDRQALTESVTLIRCGGHFPGSTALHWRDAPGGAALFPADALQVAMDRRHVSFMYSYPNHIPMAAQDVLQMRERLSDLAFDNVYGFSWARNIIGDGRAAVDASFVRDLRRMGLHASLQSR